MWIGKNNRHILMFITFIIILFSFFFVPALTKSPEYVYEGRCDACHTQAQDAFANVEPPKDIKCTNCHAISEFGPDLYTHTATTFDCIQCSQKELNVEGHPYVTIVGLPVQWMSITVDLTKEIHDIRVYIQRSDRVLSDVINVPYLLFGYLYSEVILTLIILTIAIIFIKNRINK